MKIVIIKLGADGDVLRTIPLAQALKNRHPQAHITWITRGDIEQLLKPLPFIEKVVQHKTSVTEKYDLLYNFDIEEEATKLAASIQADKKYGFYSDGGYPAAYNSGAEYYINTVFDDSLKKSNRKTYQQMMFDLAELPYSDHLYHLKLTEEEKEYASKFAKHNNLSEKKIIGVHMGASSRWPSKVWARDCLLSFIKKASSNGYEILLFGGPNEVESQKSMKNELLKEEVSFYSNDPNNTKGQFASLVGLCDTIVCSDSFALHVSLGLGKKTVALFFCTSPYEVEGYGLLTKIVSPRLQEFFPERSNEYNLALTQSISSDEVMNAVRSS